MTTLSRRAGHNFLKFAGALVNLKNLKDRYSTLPQLALRATPWVKPGELAKNKPIGLKALRITNINPNNFLLAPLN